MKTIKVLHILSFMSIGGIESRLIDFLDKPVENFAFYVFSPYPIQLYWREKLTSLRIPFSQVTDRKKWESELAKFALQNRIQIAHFHQPWPKAKYALKKAGIKVILEHDHGAVWLHSPSEIKEDKQNIKIVQGVIAVSKASRLMLEKRLGYHPDQIKVIHNGINFEKLKVNRAVPRPPDKKIITTICRLTFVKGVDSLINAIPYVLAEKKEVEFWIIGDGRLRDQLERLTSNLGITGSVKFWGNQWSVADYLTSTDLFVLPSIREPFGGVLIEAAFFAIPSIAANVDGNPEIIENEKTGILLKPSVPIKELNTVKKNARFPRLVIDGETKQLQKPLGLDPKDLGKAILSLIQQPEMCQTMGKDARERALKLFNIDRYRKDIIDYYLKMLGK
jgi:glycosyltransferase involved in cell wall biosynthesis